MMDTWTKSMLMDKEKGRNTTDKNCIDLIVIEWEIHALEIDFRCRFMIIGVDPEEFADTLPETIVPLLTRPMVSEVIGPGVY